jgi:hypothetical protein
MSRHRAPTNFFGGTFCYTDLYRQILQIQLAFIAKTFNVVLIIFTYIYLYSKKNNPACATLALSPKKLVGALCLDICA